MTETRVARIRKERVRIPMSDGIALAAMLWLPEDASAERRYPPVLEYAPYRLDDMGIEDMYEHSTYISQHGIASVRVDMRGTGASEGVLPPAEYSKQEMSDGLEVIEWLSRQPWSNGKLGMWGKSWTGINTLMIARLQPPALKAIAITASAPDDEFHDDRYFEGFLNIDSWDLIADHIMTRPRAPDFPLDEATLSARFDQEPWLAYVLREQRNGPFWKRQALGRDYDSVRVPVLWIAGWYDGNQDSVPTVLERLSVPVKAVVGPWAHEHADNTKPGPGIHWQHVCLRWWNCWLKSEDTGVLDEPRLAVFVQHWHPSGELACEAPGIWRLEDWPITRTVEEVRYLGPERMLSTDPPPVATQRLRYKPSVGSSVPMYWEGFLPDPAPDDAYSLTFDSAPLETDLEILGSPKALIHGSSDAPLAHWFARLEDVSPDGTITTVTGGGLNGAQRESDLEPSALEPGIVYLFEFDLHFMSWVFPRGHRIRVSVRNAWWPVAWPTPYPMTTSLCVGGDEGSRLVLPVIPFEERPTPAFAPPNRPSLLIRRAGETPSTRGSGTTLIRSPDGSAVLRQEVQGKLEFDWGSESHRSELTHRVNDARPDLASAHGEIETEVDLGDRRISWQTMMTVESTATSLKWQIQRRLVEDGLQIRERAWQGQVSRDHH